MRIVVVGSPQSGDTWLRCLLAALYDLEPLAPVQAPSRANLSAFRGWIADGGFRDDSVLLQNVRYAPEIASALEALGALIVTPVRNPYDLFAATYLAAQARPASVRSSERKRPRKDDVLVGKPFDHPDVLTFLAEEFGTVLARTTEWLDSERSSPVRYEDVAADPAAALQPLSQHLGPFPAERVAAALTDCEQFKGQGTRPAKRRRDGDAAEALPELSEAHLLAFARHAPIVRKLGYEPRFPADFQGDTGPWEEPDHASEEIPPVARMRWGYARKGGREGFLSVGAGAVKRFVEHCDLRPDERVLDVGSGVGRIALGLTHFLNGDARYDGFDVDAEGIAWCQQHITPRYPNFRFQVADVYNKHYHPEGSQPASQYRFPYDDASFDFVFLTSVFTHLLPADLENYVRQIERVLAPGGRAFITMFLLNGSVDADIRRGASVRTFPHDHGVYRVEDEEFPERAIAFDEAHARRVFTDNGLPIRDPILFGGWPRRKEAGEGGQDAVVAVKRS